MVKRGKLKIVVSKPKNQTSYLIWPLTSSFSWLVYIKLGPEPNPIIIPNGIATEHKEKAKPF